MQSDSWIERWQQNQIGFHQETINPYLKNAWKSLGVEPGATVFVPLCGKSRDMLWLRKQGHPIIGIEISELAITQFFDELNIQPTISHIGKFKSYSVHNLTLLQGDYFELTPDYLEGVAAIYDRAALIALPSDMRKAYVEHLYNLLPDHTRKLLITMEYPDGQMSGPPFCVFEDEVMSLYAQHANLARLEAHNVLEENIRFQDRGLTEMWEKVFALT